MVFNKMESEANALSIKKEMFIGKNEGVIKDYYDMGDRVGEGTYGLV